MKIGIYIHIPFCYRKCDYCSFYSVSTSGLDNRECSSLFERYVLRLLEEIDVRASEFSGYYVDTIYFGGGTPSIIPPYYIKRIIDCIYDNFSVKKSDIEFSIECNPEDFSLPRIDEYIDAGINRVVLGAQTLCDRMHKLIGRSAKICDEKLLEDFTSIPDIIHCIDLMTAIPGQTEQELLSDLSIIEKFRFEHISAYILSIEKGTALGDRYKKNPEHEDSRRAFELVIEYLKKSGYRHYEVSNFALPEYASKHNLKYWQFDPYIGFGAASHSFYNGERYYNPLSVVEFFNKSGPLKKDVRHGSSIITEFIMMGMRLLKGISLNDLKSKTGLDFPENIMERIFEMEKAGYVLIDENSNDIYVRFTYDGFFIMDKLILDMVELVI